MVNQRWDGSIFSVATLGIYHSLAPLSHSNYYGSKVVLCNSFPSCLYYKTQFSIAPLASTRWIWIVPLYLILHFIPHCFYRVEIWTERGPVYKIYLPPQYFTKGCLCSMTWSIIMHEKEAWIHPYPALYHWQNPLAVGFAIDRLPILLPKDSWTFGTTAKAAPEYLTPFFFILHLLNRYYPAPHLLYESPKSFYDAHLLPRSHHFRV